MENIREKFEEIEDRRHASYVKHNLADALIIVMGAELIRITELADMMAILRAR
ncbi:MAG: hypothetical protein LBL35_01330 [Clostridiales bacterium]|jgi:hypothetical protein|nr:hypothetical protein [Clostridiales bacterium]